MEAKEVESVRHCGSDVEQYIHHLVMLLRLDLEVSLYLASFP